MNELHPQGRHLFALPRGTASDPQSRSLVIARLLEEGNRSELAWLANEIGREEIAVFVRDRGGRKLSARSRCFWSRALRVESSPPHRLAEKLWPLA